MGEPIPEYLRAEQQAVEAEIRAAFQGVSRTGGVSWRQSELEDSYGHDDGNVPSDRDRRWEELVDDGSWEPEPGVGGFTFLDAIGFRYYIAPGMIRCLRVGCDLGLTSAFEYARSTSVLGGKLDKLSMLSGPQKQAIARFIRFMIAVHRAAHEAELAANPWKVGDPYWKQDRDGKPWQIAYQHWKQFDQWPPTERGYDG